VSDILSFDCNSARGGSMMHEKCHALSYAAMSHDVHYFVFQVGKLAAGGESI